jgi:inner membrane protein
VDIVTHGLAGALVARGVGARPAWPVVGAAVLGALAPDLDALARLWDPMAPITVHRTATHSVVGGLLLAGAVAGVLRLAARRARFRTLAGFAYLGVLSHVVLDLLTSFGTAALWPISSRRFGLGWLYVIDPVVSGLVLGGLLLAWRSASLRVAAPRVALGALAVYALAAGALGELAAAQWRGLLADRGVAATRLAVVPTFPGPLRWVAVAEAEAALYRARFWLPAVASRELATFPRGQLDGLVGLDASPEVRAFLAFARFPWLTVTPEGDLRRVEYLDLAFEDHPFGGPMALRLTVDPAGAVRSVELGHKL